VRMSQVDTDVILEDSEQRTIDDKPEIHFIKARVPTSLLDRSHLSFLLRHTAAIPGAYAALDQNRLTVLFFNLGALDILDEIDQISEHRQHIVNWIYSLQISTAEGAAEDACGFRGSFTTAIDPKGTVSGKVHDAGNLAQTYSALLSLAILGDDMSKVKRSAILNTVKKAQTELGCFASQGAESECDMRYVYCAVAIAYMLGDDSCIDWKRLGEFMQKCVNYDGGIGQMPGDESHGGSTYCAVAALSLANRLWDESVLTRKQIGKLIKWAILKQDRGFHGRANKPDDSCYAFWIGATLEMLSAFSLVGQDELRTFLYSVQFPPLGGFCKLQETGAHPDVLHTYFSLAALSIMKEPGFQPMHAPLNITRRVHETVARRRIHFAHHHT
ncbi:hypothetical protein PFISCL1PPCAC_8028, partial [Pristionchus fissidentatus]